MVRARTGWLLLAMLAAASLAQAQTVLTSASNVRLRESAGSDAAVSAVLPLGSTLQVRSAGENGWIPVTWSSTGRQGWVHESLVIRVNASNPLETATALMDHRLARHGDGLMARLELLDFVEGTLAAQRDRPMAAPLQLRRLKALQQVLQAIPHDRSSWDADLQRWVAGRAPQIMYNEPGGQWMVRPAHLHDLQDQHRGTPEADEIGWFGVQIGLAGECEGNLVCYLQRLDALEGEYLRRHPAGRHADEVLKRMASRIDALMAERPLSGRLYFATSSDCGPMQETVRTLQAAAQASRAAAAAQLREKLSRFSCAHAKGIARY